MGIRGVNDLGGVEHFAVQSKAGGVDFVDAGLEAQDGVVVERAVHHQGVESGVGRIHVQGDDVVAGSQINSVHAGGAEIGTGDVSGTALHEDGVVADISARGGAGDGEGIGSVRILRPGNRQAGVVSHQFGLHGGSHGSFVSTALESIGFAVVNDRIVVGSGSGTKVQSSGERLNFRSAASPLGLDIQRAVDSLHAVDGQVGIIIAVGINAVSADRHIRAGEVHTQISGSKCTVNQGFHQQGVPHAVLGHQQSAQGRILIDCRDDGVIDVIHADAFLAGGHIQRHLGGDTVECHRNGHGAGSGRGDFKAHGIGGHDFVLQGLRAVGTGLYEGFGLIVGAEHEDRILVVGVLPHIDLVVAHAVIHFHRAVAPEPHFVIARAQVDGHIVQGDLIQ